MTKEVRLVEFKAVYESIMDYGRGNLGSAEFLVLLFVFDRTLRWGKRVERISVSHFVEGVPNVCPGVGRNRTVVKEVLATLRRKNWLVYARGRIGQPSLYGVNYVMENDRAILGANVKLRVPKKKREGSSWVGNRPIDGSEIDPRHGSESDPLNQVKIKQRITKPRNSERGKVFEEVEEAEEFARRHNMNALQKRIKKDKPTASTFHAVWKQKSVENYPGVRVGEWLMRDQGLIMRYARAFGLHDYAEFLGWCVESWPSIMSYKFSRLEDAPDVPEIRFFLRNHTRFLDSFARKQNLARVSTLSLDAQEMQALRQSGMSEEEARMKVAERRVLEKHRKEIEEQKKLATQMMRAADIATRQGTKAPNDKKSKGAGSLVAKKLKAAPLRRWSEDDEED